MVNFINFFTRKSTDVKPTGKKSKWEKVDGQKVAAKSQIDKSK